MMHEPNVSLVIVSRNRPAGLRRLITALRFQTYKSFEVIVVTNTQDRVSDRINYIEFDQPNISAARNLGIEASSGQLVAFCDDDAVPEPVWLEKLVEPFAEPKVSIAGGYVRGRNGIDFQWKAQAVNQFGTDIPLVLEDDTKTQVFGESAGLHPRVQGTNCIFRKSVLLELGGFDESFAFYLDETDVCYRASKLGWMTAFVPLAEVQHGFEESDRRTAERAPRSLFVEGQSKAYFCRKHAANLDAQQELEDFVEDQRNRLLSLMIAGIITPNDVNALLKTLNDGLKSKIEPNNHKRVTSPKSVDFNSFKLEADKTCWGEVFAGSIVSRKALLKAAFDASQQGVIATVFCWSFTSFFHQRYFNEKGFWVQQGGLFGKSNRNDSYFQLTTLKKRSEKEAKWVKNMRKIEKINLFRFKKLASVVK